MFEEMPSVKTHTLGFEKIYKVLEYSNNHLAKSIFYTQLLFQFGMVQMKNIALVKNIDLIIYSLITSRNIKKFTRYKKRKKYDTFNGSSFS